MAELSLIWCDVRDEEIGERVPVGVPEELFAFEALASRTQPHHGTRRTILSKPLTLQFTTHSSHHPHSLACPQRRTLGISLCAAHHMQVGGAKGINPPSSGANQDLSNSPQLSTKLVGPI